MKQPTNGIAKYLKTLTIGNFNFGRIQLKSVEYTKS